MGPVAKVEQGFWSNLWMWKISEDLLHFFMQGRTFFGGALKRFKSLGFRCHPLRHENLHNFEKNLDQTRLLRKKLYIVETSQRKNLRSKNFEKIEKFHRQFFIEN